MICADFAAFRSWLVGAAVAIVLPSGALAACNGTWDLSGRWYLSQANGYLVVLDLRTSASTTSLKGRAAFQLGVSDRVDGMMTGERSFSFTVPWSAGGVGVYSGDIDGDGRIRGYTFDQNHPEAVVAWQGDRVANCNMAAATAPSGPSKQPGAGRLDQFGDVKLPKGGAGDVLTQVKPNQPPGQQVATAIDDVDIYDGPGGQFRIIGMMIAGEQAPVSGHHQDGWYRLQVQVNQGIVGGWVAEDHLQVSP